MYKLILLAGAAIATSACDGPPSEDAAAVDDNLSIEANLEMNAADSPAELPADAMTDTVAPSGVSDPENDSEEMNADEIVNSH